jgi:cell division protein FtsB
MKWLAVVLLALLAAIQWPLWFGKGGWLRVAELDRQLSESRAANVRATDSNAQLVAEVASFKTGREAVEDRARMQLNMVRDDEIFFQYVPAGGKTAAAGADAKKE